MLKFIHIAVIIALVTLHYVQALAGNNSGQAFSLWPDTGQTTCYDTAGAILDPCPSEGQPFYGQDAQYTGPTRSYTKLDTSGNDLSESAPSWAMVRDNVTGLIWEVKQNRDSVSDYANAHDADNSYTWCDTNPDTNGGDPGTCGTNDTEDFLAALNSGSGFAGHTDWRLPTINELKTLVDMSRNNPNISTTYFPNTVSAWYWSSTTDAAVTYSPWFLDFNSGGGDGSNKKESYKVRAVRGGQVPSEIRFVVNTTTVNDIVTCLEWQRATADNNGDGVPDPMTWENALAYAEGLSLDGHTDWRLPDFNELSSIVDYSQYDPAVDPIAFPDTVSSDYWSSTTHVVGTLYVWLVYFYDGYNTFGLKPDHSRYVRVVRSGQCGTLGYSTITATVGGNGSLDELTPSPQTVANGSASQFTFNADTGYHVAEVTGCGVNYSNTSNTIASYTATTGIITGDCTVSATFAINTYYTVNSSVSGGNGTIAPLGDQVVDYGATPSFTLTPDSNYHVADVSGTCGGTLIGNTFTTNPVTANCTVVATFAINQYSVSATAGANGSLNAGTPSPQTVNYGATTQFTFNANTGYHVAGITGCGVNYSNTSNAVTNYTATTGSITGDCTVSATFSINQYTVFASAGANGSLDPGTPSPQTVNHGFTTQFTFNANTGYHVAGITGCGVNYSNTSNAVTSYTATTGSITGECTVSATFGINQYMLSSSTGANGMISPLGTVVVNHGSNQGYTITPNTNYHVADVLVDGGSVGAVTSYQFTNVTANHSISASYAINQYTLSVTIEGGGTGSVINSSGSINCPGICSEEYEHSKHVNLTAVPGEGSIFAGWFGDCTGTGTTCNVTVDRAINVIARFNVPFPWPMFMPAIQSQQ